MGIRTQHITAQSRKQLNLQVLHMNELMYDALMLGRNREVAKEEYLVARGEKEPARFRICEKVIEFSDVVGDVSAVIPLELTVPGYLEIEAISRDRIIILGKKIITSDDFTEGRYDFPFRISSFGCHVGKNFARITFRTPACSENVDIIINNKVAAGADTETGEKYCRIVKSYLDLRLGRISQKQWQEESEDIIGTVNGSGPHELFMMLYRAQVLLSVGRSEEARGILEFVSEQIRKLPPHLGEIRCYYLYVQTLTEPSDEKTRKAAQKIREVYEREPSWRLLWMLFYTSSEYDGRPLLKYEAISEEFRRRHCSSPVMFYEALECIRADHSLIRDLSDFELQVLLFALKNDALTLDMAIRLSDIIMDMDESWIKRRNIPMAVKLLQGAYDSLDSNTVLKSLIKLLIAGGCRDRASHSYYKKAIEAFLELPGLYEYYIFTSDAEWNTDPGTLPEDVLRHFEEGCAELAQPDYDWRRYYYALLVTFKRQYFEYYKKALPEMTAFARENIFAGNSDESLALIYRDMFETGRVTSDLCRFLFEILCIRRIRVENSLIKGILVFHKELFEYQEEFFENGSAFVKVYSPDHLYLFKDAAGNLYKNIDFTETEPLARNEFLDVAIKSASITRNMLVGDTFELLKAERDPVEILTYMFDTMGTGRIRRTYEEKILREMIAIVAKEADADEVGEKLFGFLKLDLDPDTKGKLIEVMINKKLYQRAYEEIEKNGIAGIGPKPAADLAHVLAQLSDYADDDIVTRLCVMAFMKGENDPVVLRYLIKNYDGRMDVMLKVHTRARLEEIQDSEVLKRIAECALREENFSGQSRSAFEQYYKEGGDHDLIVRYLSAMAEKYLSSSGRECSECFSYIETELKNETGFADTVLIAFLLYMRKKNVISAATKKIIENMLREFSGRGIMLEEFKEYRKFFTLPGALSNTVIVEVFAPSAGNDPDGPLTKDSFTAKSPLITYEISGRSGRVKGSEHMREIFEGCYVKYFTLFCGENVRYKVEGRDSGYVEYSDLEITDDNSRYANIDNLIKLADSHDYKALAKAAEDYYIKSRIIEKLF